MKRDSQRKNRKELTPESMFRRQSRGRNDADV
jgi:hypothetical protein